MSIKYYCPDCGSVNTYTDISIGFSKCTDCSFYSPLDDPDLIPVFDSSFFEDHQYSSLNSGIQAVQNFSSPAKNLSFSVTDTESFDDIPF